MQTITQNGIQYSYQKCHYNSRYELFDNSCYIGGLVLDYETREYWVIVDADDTELERTHYNNFGTDWAALEWAIEVLSQ